MESDELSLTDISDTDEESVWARQTSHEWMAAIHWASFIEKLKDWLYIICLEMKINIGTCWPKIIMMCDED